MKFAPDNDCYANDSLPNQNFNGQTLEVSDQNGPAGTSISLIHFNISSMPQNVTITHAYLVLDLNGDNQSFLLQIGRLGGSSTQGWSEFGVTWNARPQLANTPAPETFNASLGSAAYDVTTFVKAWYAGTYFNNGFQLSDTYPPGSYGEFLSKENGSGAPYLLVSYDAAPPTPSLGSPTNGAANLTVNPILNWNSSNGATSYHLQVSLNSNFSSLVFDKSGIANTSQQVTGLKYGTNYYWRVSAANATGNSSYSGAWTLTTIMNAPTLISPSNGSTGLSTSPTLRWNSSADAVSYRLQVAADANFSSRVYDQSGLTGTSRTVTGLSNGGTYYWRLNASGASATSSYSDTWSFSTVPLPSSAPSLVYPSNQAINVPVDTTLYWIASTGATSYHVQISPNSSFSPLTFDKSGIVGTSQVVSGLTNGMTYYWHVNATGSGGTGSYSPTGTFTTIVTAPSSPVANPATGVDTAQFTANWNAVAVAESYLLDVATDNTFTHFVPGYQALNVGAVTTYDVKDLSSGSTYYYRIRSHNTGGSSDYSNTISIETMPSPPRAAPPGSDDITPNSFTAKWQTVRGAVGYQLDVSTSSSFTSYLSGYENKNVGDVDSCEVTGVTENASYSFRVRAYDKNGVASGNSNVVTFTLTSIEKTASGIPATFSLSQNYRNPFNPTTEINFGLPKRAFVRLAVFDVLGREASILVDNELSAGSYRVRFDASRLESGVYFYRLVAGGHVITKKMLFVK